MIVRDAAYVLGVIEVKDPKEVSDVYAGLSRIFSIPPAWYEYDKDYDDILKSEFSPERCSYDAQYPSLGEMYMAVFIALMRITKHGDMSEMIRKLPAEYRSLGLHSWRRALGFVGEIGLPNLIATLKDDDEWTRYWAVDGLRHTGLPDAVPPLVSALHDASQRVRAKAADALRELGAIEELRRAGTTESMNALEHLREAKT